MRARRTPPRTEPLVEGCPCPTCARHSRAYLHYLSRAEAPTAARLLTLHNLTFLERLVAGAREAIVAKRFGEYRRPCSPGTHPGRPSNHRARPDAEAQKKSAA